MPDLSSALMRLGRLFAILVPADGGRRLEAPKTQLLIYVIGNVSYLPTGKLKRYSLRKAAAGALGVDEAVARHPSANHTRPMRHAGTAETGKRRGR